MKKADISINLIMVMLITIVSILLLLGLFSAKLPTFAKSMYCKTFFYIHSSTFLPRAIRQDQTYCKGQDFMETHILTNETPLNTSLLGYMIACWEKSGFGKSSNNLRCFELTLSQDIPTPQDITEKRITQILSDNRICDTLSNNDFEADPEPLICGQEDQITWSIVGPVQKEQNILVEYAGGKIIIS